MDSTDPSFPLNLTTARSNLKSRNLNEIISVLEKFGPKRRGERGEDLQSVFNEIKPALKAGDQSLEQLLFDKIIPPALQCDLKTINFGWLQLSSDIFHLNPIFKTPFVTNLLNTCVSYPTHLIYSVYQSDAMEVLIKNNLDSVNFESSMQALSSLEDSRALYAMKALQFYSDWEKIAGHIFDIFTLSKFTPSRSMAWHLLRNRSNVDELKELSIKNDIFLSPEAKASDDCVFVLTSIHQASS